MSTNSSSSGSAVVDALHPAICFHREVLNVQEWAQIRRDFLEMLQRIPRQSQSGGSSSSFLWKEPKKLWRHSQEALGKWVLSQVARLNADAVDLRRDLFFFPTEGVMRAGSGNDAPCVDVHVGSSEPAEGEEADSKRRRVDLGPIALPSLSYDAQLLRDLSIKSSAAHNRQHVAVLSTAIESFGLLARCTAAAQRVQAKMRHVTPTTAIAPRIQELTEGDDKRRPHQQRIKDVIVEISAVCAEAHRQNYPVVSITRASFEKLRRSYAHFGEANDIAQYGSSDEGGRTFSPEDLFLRRAACVALRYEGCLATGSLQLCADTTFKQHLHASGYHVVDLCASPINAYCGVPQVGVFGGSTQTKREEVPNAFCSAFLDTDFCFGSLGSALRVTLREIHEACERQEREEKKEDAAPTPLLLTYDVPYDEDLCQRLFLKLENDLRATLPAGLNVDYILVLPLWWRIPLRIPKTVFMKSKVHIIPVDHRGDMMMEREGDGVTHEVQELVASRAAMLQDGYVISYTWPERLAAAVGTRLANSKQQQQGSNSATRHTAGDDCLCWDALFLDESYSYFCTSTNQWLSGVTATEVIALHTPQSGSSTTSGHDRLVSAIASFYGKDAYQWNLQCFRGPVRENDVGMMVYSIASPKRDPISRIYFVKKRLSSGRSGCKERQSIIFLFA
eukprot:gene3859-2737_t